MEINTLIVQPTGNFMTLKFQLKHPEVVDVQALFILSGYGYIEQVRQADKLHILIIFKPQRDTF